MVATLSRKTHFIHTIERFSTNWRNCGCWFGLFWGPSVTGPWSGPSADHLRPNRDDGRIMWHCLVVSSSIISHICLASQLVNDSLPFVLQRIGFFRFLIFFIFFTNVSVFVFVCVGLVLAMLAKLGAAWAAHFALRSVRIRISLSFLETKHRTVCVFITATP